MAIKYLALLLIIVGCGRDVNLTNSKLESVSQITNPDSPTLEQSGVLHRKSVQGTLDQIQVSGQMYQISLNSSYNALEFVAKKPLGSVTNVNFRGKVRTNEILLESMK